MTVLAVIVIVAWLVALLSAAANPRGQAAPLPSFAIFFCSIALAVLELAR